MLGKFLQDRRLWIITIVIFVLLVTFFDKNNLVDAWRLKQSIDELDRQREYYQQKITADSTILEDLKNDQYLEQYAREKYLMKRKGETIYIIR